MKALIVYESLFGATQQVAEAMAEGMLQVVRAEIAPVEDAGPARVAAADLLVVGGPTHVRGMAWSMADHGTAPTGGHRAEGHDARRRRVDGRTADHDSPPTERDDRAFGESLRRWLHRVPEHVGMASVAGRAAAFDTRPDHLPVPVGRAASGIARRLRRGGFQIVVEPESFLVDQDDAVLPGEVERALRWGRSLTWSLEASPAR